MVQKQLWPRCYKGYATFARRRHVLSSEAQKEDVANFAQDWEPFDRTKQLE